MRVDETKEKKNIEVTVKIEIREVPLFLLGLLNSFFVLLIILVFSHLGP